MRDSMLIYLLVCSLFFFGYSQLSTSVLISSPFDNFRVECPRMSGAQRLGIRMIESQGMKRQDAIYTLSCNHINELYPWTSISPDIVDIEREDCHYSPPFDPIIESNVSLTCNSREYMAGIARLSDTRIQVECCRLRSRDETGCVEEKFPKPIGTDSRSEIELNAKLINAISITGRHIRVRFCDLAPRAYELIRADVPTTTSQRPTTVRPLRSTTSGDDEPTTSAEEVTENLAALLGPKRIIKILQKSSLSQKWSTQRPDNVSSTASLDALPTTDDALLPSEPVSTTRDDEAEVATTSTFRIELIRMTTEPVDADVQRLVPIEEEVSSGPAVQPATNSSAVGMDWSTTSSSIAAQMDDTSSTGLPTLHRDFTLATRPTTASTTPTSGSESAVRKSPKSPGDKATRAQALLLESSGGAVTARHSSTAGTSVEVTAATRTAEKEFPSEKDYENVEEATAELMRSIAGMLEARHDAKNILKRVKAAGLPQNKQAEAKSEEFAENTLKEIEEKDGAQDLMKESMEMLNELARVGSADDGEEHEYDEEAIIEKEVEVMTKIRPIGRPPATTSAAAVTAQPSSSAGVEKVVRLPSGGRSQSGGTGQRHAFTIPIYAASIESAYQNSREFEDISAERSSPSPKGAESASRKPNVGGALGTTSARPPIGDLSKKERRGGETTLPPLDNFPSPPPANRTKPPIVLAQFRKTLKHMEGTVFTTTTTTTTITNEDEPPKVASGGLRPTSSRHRTIDSVEDEDLGDGPTITATTHRELSTTRSPPVSRAPPNRRKFFNPLPASDSNGISGSSSVEEIRLPTVPVPPQTRAPAHRNAATLAKFSRNRAKGEAVALSSSPAGGLVAPYVDEETDESPFDDRNGARQAVAALPSNGGDSDIELYEQLLRQHRRQQPHASKTQLSQASDSSAETTEVASATTARSAAGGHGRFENPESRFDKQSPFDVSSEIRRISDTGLYDIREQIIDTRHKKYETSTNESTSGAENIEQTGHTASSDLKERRSDYAEKEGAHHSQQPTKERMDVKDGFRSFVPKNNRPVEMPKIIVYDIVDSRSSPPAIGRQDESAKSESQSHPNVVVNDLVPMQEEPQLSTIHSPQPSSSTFSAASPTAASAQTSSSSSEVTQTTPTKVDTVTTITDVSSRRFAKESPMADEPVIPDYQAPQAEEEEGKMAAGEDDYWTRRTTLEPPATPPPYNPAQFYYVPKKRRQQLKEKVLTFCSKDTAIRDRNNLIIACGVDNEVWHPNRCPENTDCFVASDSTYRICCPVSFG